MLGEMSDGCCEDRRDEGSSERAELPFCFHENRRMRRIRSGWVRFSSWQVELPSRRWYKQAAEAPAD